MKIIEKIRQTGIDIAYENNILSSSQSKIVLLPNEVMEDFIERVKNDLFEFNYYVQFDPSFNNLFNRAFMYVYGKGAEYTFFTKLGNTISKINYDFDIAMQAKCGDKLPNHILFKINKQANIMLEMYFQMCLHLKGSTEKLISEETTYSDCMTTILSLAFLCGQHICSTIELSDEDKLIVYNEESDKPYDYDNYDNRYQLEDFRVINYRFGDFNEIKDQLGLV